MSTRQTRGRRPGGSDTRAAIEAAARRRFAEVGYPRTTMRAIAADAGEGSSTAATVTMGNSGGVVIPWLQGRILVNAGPSQGVFVTAVLCAAMFGITAVFRARRLTV